MADLTTGALPWTVGERSRPNKQLFYEVYLGAIRMDGATEQLIKAFGADEEGGSRMGEKAALGALLLDRNGCLLDENAVAISSFGWALPLALDLRLGELGNWPAVELRALEQLEKRFRRVDRQGRPIPLDRQLIEEAHRWIVDEFRIPAALIEAPSFAVRIYHYYKAKKPPEATLLNSFFLADLSRAQDLVASGQAKPGLKRYLGIQAPNKTFDLQQDRPALEEAVAPALIPAACWPSPGGHPLVLLQQAAVNLARRECARDGLIAINGPPGTGKTTLLRDIVAGAVLDRALAMAGFDDPKDAFATTGQKTSAGPQAFYHLYRLADDLRGHEVVVASSNNKAVENVSRELPASAAIGRGSSEANYFTSISDFLHGPRDPDDDELDGTPDEPINTWGLIAAVLGNAGNRFHFTQRFWWNQDRGFRTYLKAAKGDSVVREETNEAGKVVRRETPSVVTLERPPAPQALGVNWRRARERLTKLHREVEAELKALEAVRRICLELAAAKRELAEAEAALTPLLATHRAAQAMEVELRRPRDAAKLGLDRSEMETDRHRLDRPGFFYRLFRTQAHRSWLKIQVGLTAEHARTTATYQAAAQAHQLSHTALDRASAELHEGEQAHLHASTTVARLTQQVDAHRPTLGRRIIDRDFFESGHKQTNLTAPWVPESLHRKRENLFLAALDVHRAFINASAQKVLHNLSVLMDVLSNEPPQNEDKRDLLGHLWSTLFLVVPVISTTFASMEAMFGELKPDDLGWLLVDEAGQALPQAAVGGVMRARRTVVVGDPLQIPPVVSLPDRLTGKVGEFFDIDCRRWAAPEASVQTLGDKASRFRGGFDSDVGRREVGVPLLVHRRCQEPMFGFSNEIAYDGQMVHAVGPSKPGPVGALIGASRWFDVGGEATSKWCDKEGEVVIGLLQSLAAAGVIAPDLFIITPFRIVADELRRRLENEAALFAALKVRARDWLKDRVGTIHTVQGREADTVILVLGAPTAAQGGARSWAAGTPNILNVAVSRAKQSIYVVGSYGAWSGVGHATTLAKLPRQLMF